MKNVLNLRQSESKRNQEKQFKMIAFKIVRRMGTCLLYFLRKLQSTVFNREYDQRIDHLVVLKRHLCFVCLRLVFPMFPVSLDYPLLIAPSVFSNVYLLQISHLIQHYTRRVSAITFIMYTQRRVSAITFIMYTQRQKIGRQNNIQIFASSKTIGAINKAKLSCYTI